MNPEAFRGRGVIRIFMEEGTTLYRGWGWTVARNAPGSFAVCPVLLRLRPLRRVNVLFSAFRCVRRDEGVSLRHPGLPQGDLGPELRRVDRRRGCVHYRRGAARHGQDAYPERELRAEGVGCYCGQGSDQERGSDGVVQRLDTEGK